MLQGSGFVRVYPRVWRLRDHEMSDDDWVEAARLALPSDAYLTGISRLQRLGLDFGPRKPVHFVVDRDLHLAFEGVFLHRTVKLPPTCQDGVCIEAAFMAYCVRARVIDAIKVGDWLLHNGHVDIGRLEELAVADPWRDGADEVLWILAHLDSDSWSIKESETRALITFCGLPRPDCNRALDLCGRIVVPDMRFAELGLVVEYEGRQHQEDRDQYTKDVDRYGLMRDHGVPYLQVTDEKLQRPRKMMNEVYAALIKLGYDGPTPQFGERWQSLFRSVRDVVGPRDQWRRTA